MTFIIITFVAILITVYCLVNLSSKSHEENPCRTIIDKNASPCKKCGNQPKAFGYGIVPPKYHCSNMGCRLFTVTFNSLYEWEGHNKMTKETNK